MLEVILGIVTIPRSIHFVIASVKVFFNKDGFIF